MIFTRNRGPVARVRIIHVLSTFTNWFHSSQTGFKIKNASIRV